MSLDERIQLRRDGCTPIAERARSVLISVRDRGDELSPEPLVFGVQIREVFPVFVVAVDAKLDMSAARVITSDGPRRLQLADELFQLSSSRTRVPHRRSDESRSFGH